MWEMGCGKRAFTRSCADTVVEECHLPLYLMPRLNEGVLHLNARLFRVTKNAIEEHVQWFLVLVEHEREL